MADCHYQRNQRDAPEVWRNGAQRNEVRSGRNSRSDGGHKSGQNNGADLSHAL